MPANPPVKPLAGKPAKLWWLLLMPMAQAGRLASICTLMVALKSGLPGISDSRVD